MVMGRYGETEKLQIWKLAREFTLCDNFFMGAFGGSFLNHQYLVAAQPPFYFGADKSPAKALITVMEGDGPRSLRPKQKSNSPKSASQGPVRFTATSLSPDHFAVNTMGPAYAPAFTTDPARPAFADPADAHTLPPQPHMTIGDLLSAKGVDWAWYSGGWNAALAGKGNEGDYPSTPNFQAHHQPLNYFATFAPGTIQRSKRLRDGGVGENAKTNRFLADIEDGRLPTVTFYKPPGDLNMHAGSCSVEAGDRHIGRLVEALRAGPQWTRMLIVVAFDENGGLVGPRGLRQKATVGGLECGYPPSSSPLTPEKAQWTTPFMTPDPSPASSPGVSVWRNCRGWASESRPWSPPGARPPGDLTGALALPT